MYTYIDKYIHICIHIYIHIPWHIHVYHLHVWRDLFTCMARLWWFKCVPRLCDTCDTTYPHIWHYLTQSYVSFQVLWISFALMDTIHTCDTTYLRVWPDSDSDDSHSCHVSFTCVTRLIHMHHTNKYEHWFLLSSPLTGPLKCSIFVYTLLLTPTLTPILTPTPTPTLTTYMGSTFIPQLKWVEIPWALFALRSGRPTFMTKETYIYVQGDLHIWPQRPTHVSKETYIHDKRDPKMTKDTYINDKNDQYMKKRNTGWQRLIGSPKLQIIFHKRATKYRSLLRKMTCKDKGSYESSPPCIHVIKETWMYKARSTSSKATILIFTK